MSNNSNNKTEHNVYIQYTHIVFCYTYNLIIKSGLKLKVLCEKLLTQK